MSTKPSEIFEEIRAVVASVPGFNARGVNSNRKTDQKHSSKTGFTASVLYAGEDNSEFIVNASNNRYDIDMPVVIEVRTTSASDDVLTDKVYDVRDAVLLPKNKPSDVILITPVSIDEPEGAEYLTCKINILVKFRRS